MATELCEIVVADARLQIAPPDGEPEAGAIVDFLGVVRGTEDGAAITGIYYEAHYEMALFQLRKVTERAREQFGCQRITLHHRIGFVPVAEPSLWVRVTAKHRGAAFAACEWIIEQLKQLVPIWKRPQYAEADAPEPVFNTSRELENSTAR